MKVFDHILLTLYVNSRIAQLWVKMWNLISPNFTQ